MNSTRSPRPPIATVPVGLRVEGRLIVVIGAGRIAARKATAYLDQGAELRVVAPAHSPAMEAVAAQAPSAVELIRAHYQPHHLDGAWMVVTATGNPAVDGAVFDDAERRRLWCNAADDPDHCSVILPAVVRREPITVAISTGGTSPATASWMRRRLETFVTSDLLSGAALDAHRIATQVRTEMREAGQPTEVDGWQEALHDFEIRLRELVGTPAAKEPTP